MRNILSIDGGGIKGVIPATILSHLEQQTGKLCRDLFSMAAGTSTGALLASAVCAGVPAQKMVEVYLNQTKYIFSPGSPWNLMKRVVTGNMYDPRRIQKVLEGVLGLAKNWTMNDVPIDLLLTSMCLSNGQPWYFVKDKESNSHTTGTFRLIDCAVASASAPTYFTPWHVNGLGDMIDGGVGVTGNPVYQAVVEAFFYDNYDPAETSILSLGTGTYTDHNNKPKGLLGWLEWTLQQLLNAPEEQQTQIVTRTYPNMPFHRYNMKLTNNVAMDDPKAVRALHEQTLEFCKTINWNDVLGLKGS